MNANISPEAVLPSGHTHEYIDTYFRIVCQLNGIYVEQSEREVQTESNLDSEDDDFPDLISESDAENITTN